MINRTATAVAASAPAVDGPARGGLYLRTFGGCCLYRDGVPVPPGAWRRQAAKQVLVRLLLAEGRPVAKQELYGTLWPDASEPAAANRLRVLLHGLRRTLEPGLPPRLPSAFVTVGRYECALPPHPQLQWDVQVLTRGLAAAACTRTAEAEIGALRLALAGIAGPWLPDVDAACDFGATRWHLNEAAVAAALRLAGLALEAGDPHLARAAAERAIAIDPGSEQAYALLLRAVGTQGMPNQVRHTYAFACTQLRRHLDADPGPGLRRAASEALAVAGHRVGGLLPRPSV
jgi:DNA-binding SARP family transcriptional activator